MGFMKRPKIQPATPIATPLPSPTPADEKKSAITTEREQIKKYGNSGRGATVLTGSGSGNKLG
jgi:hypothetical protein